MVSRWDDELLSDADGNGTAPSKGKCSGIEWKGTGLKKHEIWPLSLRHLLGSFS